MKIAYIIDLDGTLYDNSHRQHLIPADRNNTAGWVQFNAACANDILRKEVANLVRAVAAEGGDVIFLTARGEDARDPTFNRLHHDFSFAYSSDLVMRQMNDHRSAAEFKSSFISGLQSEFSVYRDHTLVAIEDDPSVVDAMRALGVTVLHIDSKCCTVKKPHHNGMMQLSNELADLKRRYAELQEVVGQRNGECDRLINEQQNLVMLVKVLCRSLKKYNHTSDLVKRATDYLTSNGMMNATDFLRGGLLSAHDQTDTAPAQFESLAGEPVSQTYKLPIEMTPEMMRAVQIGSELGAYAAANLSGAYGLFNEFWDVACRAAGNSPETPEGWKLVPTTATPSMVRAGAAAAREYMEKTGGNSPFVIYEAMVSSAPGVKS